MDYQASSCKLIKLIVDLFKKKKKKPLLMTVEFAGEKNYTTLVMFKEFGQRKKKWIVQLD